MTEPSTNGGGIRRMDVKPAYDAVGRYCIQTDESPTGMFVYHSDAERVITALREALAAVTGERDEALRWKALAMEEEAQARMDRDQARQDLERVTKERDHAISQRESAFLAEDRANSECSELMAERDDANAERDIAQRAAEEANAAVITMRDTVLAEVTERRDWFFARWQESKDAGYKELADKTHWKNEAEKLAKDKFGLKSQVLDAQEERDALRGEVEAARKLLAECLTRVKREKQYVIDYENHSVTVPSEPCLRDRIATFLASPARPGEGVSDE